jgi:hypothetical protein
MSDSMTIAIGAPNNSGSFSRSGHVRVFRWSGSAWVQKGVDVDGAAGDRSGYSVSMPDSNTMAVGAISNSVNGSNSGQVKVYKWNGSLWVQKGLAINGEASGDYSGYAVSMSDSNTVSISAPYNGSFWGHVRVYNWSGSSWVQKGTDIDGEAIGDYSGWSISLADSNTIAIGARSNDGNGNASGHVRIYKWNGTAWVQKGLDIDGEAAGDNSGTSVSMPDSNTVAIGAINNDSSGIDAGHVRIFRWDGNAWNQMGVNINGEAAGDHLGQSVSMPNSNTIVAGSPLNDGNGLESGQVQVFSFCDGLLDTSVTVSVNTLIANDTTTTYQWLNCDSTYAFVSGETNRSFTPPNTGNYSVIVSRSHCVDTSACYNVVISGLNKQKTKEEQLTVYPNPTNGAFTIESNAVNNNSSFEIRDITGKVIQKGKLSGNRTTVDLSEYSSGIYLLRVGNQNIKLVRK